MDEIISYKMCAVKVRNAKLRNYLKLTLFNVPTLKGALQSDLRMCTKEPTFYDTNSLTMFWVLAKPDCCFLIIYYTLEA